MEDTVLYEKNTTTNSKTWKVHFKHKTENVYSSELKLCLISKCAKLILKGDGLSSQWPPL